MVRQAVDTFGDLHILVNNAGILRDRVIINMTEAEWDAVIAVHLKGHFCPTRHAAAYWREQTKAGKTVSASIVHTSSTSGLFSNPGQANYGAAKTGHRDALADLRQGAVALRRALERDRARAPAPVSPRRRPASSEVVKAPEDGFDVWDPANVSPFVAYLATADCPFTGETFIVQGGAVQRVQSWTAAEKIDKGDRWTVAELAAEGSQARPARRRPVAPGPGVRIVRIPRRMWTMSHPGRISARSQQVRRFSSEVMHRGYARDRARA